MQARQPPAVTLSRVSRAPAGLSPRSGGRNLPHRFWEHGARSLRFLSTPGIEPTNTPAEQAIRFVVIDRHLTQVARSEAGQRWLERIWTALATCTQQSRLLFEVLSRLFRFQVWEGDAPAEPPKIGTSLVLLSGSFALPYPEFRL